MKVERLLNLMLHRRQNRELPFWTGETTAVLGPVLVAAGVGFDAVVLSGWWAAITFSRTASGMGDTVREEALGGDTGSGEATGGDPPPTDGLPFTWGEVGEALSLRTWPLTTSWWTRETSLAWLVGSAAPAAPPAPSLGLRLGLTSLSGRGGFSRGG